MLTGKFIPDDRIPTIEELDVGGGCKQLIIKYRNEDIIEKPKVIQAFQFLPRGEKIIDMQPIKQSVFPWHDFWVYVITSAPAIFTLVFAKSLMSVHAFHWMFIAAFTWFWMIFLINTKWREK